MKEIEQENLRMMGRLVNVKPTDSINKLKNDFKTHRNRVKVIQKIQKVVTNEKRPVIESKKQQNVNIYKHPTSRNSVQDVSTPAMSGVGKSQ